LQIINFLNKTRQDSLTVWFTGLSGAGKTSISNLVQEYIEKDGFRTLVLDGDDIRSHRHRSLGFSKTDIIKNNDLILQMCFEERSAYDVIMVPIISPYRTSRAAAYKLLSPGFMEVYIYADISVLEQRDTKGLYAAAKNNKIDDMIGYSSGSPYEPPLNADVTLKTNLKTLNECAQILYETIIKKLSSEKQGLMDGL